MGSKTTVAITALVLAVRLATLRAWPLWYDEIFTARLAALSYPQLITATAGDVHPPLYYSLTWLVYHLGGQSELAIRLPSLAFSLASIPLMLSLMTHLGVDRLTQIITGIGLAVLESQNWYAHEARMYALFQFLVIAALLAAIMRRYTILAILNLALLYTHNYAVFYVPLLGLFVLSRERRLGAWLWSFVIPLVMFLPWALVLMRQVQSTGAGYWLQPPDLGDVIYSVFAQFWNLGLPSQLKPLTPLVSLGLVTLGVVKSHRQPWFPQLMLWAAGPFILAILASIIQPVYLFRGFYPSSPALIILAASGIAGVRPSLRWYPGLVAAPLVLVSLWYLVSQQVPMETQRTMTVINQLRHELMPGDLVYHVAESYYLSWSYYAPDLPQYLARPCHLTPGGLSETTRQALGFREANPAELPDHQRLVVIVGVHQFVPGCQVAFIEQIRSIPHITQFIDWDSLSTFEVWLYEKAPAIQYPAP